MSWNLIMRVGTLLSFAYTVRQVTEEHREKKQIVKPERIYSSREIGRLLNMERKEVVALLQEGRLKGRLINGNFRVSGHNILEYLKNEV